MSRQLYYGDNLDVMRRKIHDECVDLCYIDPPFNSKRNYNQIYNNVGSEDHAQSQAFTDTWVWDEHAAEGYAEILANDRGRFSAKTVDLIKGLHAVLSEGSLFAYLVSMTLRVTEIHRILKNTGSFYLHCDPTASHYLKLVLDAIFCGRGGDYLNEIIWHYNTGGKGRRTFLRKHDTIFWYVKSKEDYLFNRDEIAIPRKVGTAHLRHGVDADGREYYEDYSPRKSGKQYRWYLDEGLTPMDVWTDIQAINPAAKERLGYPTQKPEALLERIIRASSNEGDTVFDAYCGCGTTIAVAEHLKRKWVGIDITYQSISLILRRLEGQHGSDMLGKVKLDGIPKDKESAQALAFKKDDRLRKEFEKWAVLSYTNNRAVINDKKGGDKGIDGTAYFLTGKDDNAKIVFQVKSGHVQRGDIAKLNSDRIRENAELAVFITLESPTSGMEQEAKAAGFYEHELMNRRYQRVQLVTINELIQEHKRLDIPMSLEVLKKAQAIASRGKQGDLLDDLPLIL